MSDVNRDLLNSFIDESLDALASVDALFVSLEADSNNKETINAIFRPIHSLKGNAAYFGLMNIKKCAHTMETLLDQVRQGIRIADRTCTNALLPGVDLLKEMLSNVRMDLPEIPDNTQLEKILGQLQGSISMPSGTPAAKISDIVAQLRSNCSAESHKLLDELSRLLNTPQQETPSQLSGQPTKILPPAQGAANMLHTLLHDVTSIPVGSDLERQTAACIDELLSDGKNFPLPVALELKDIFTTFTSTDAGLDTLALSLLCEKLGEAVSFSDTGLQDSQKKTTVVLQTAANTNGNRQPQDKTMRVPEQALDDFLRWVGELLGVEEIFRYIIRQVTTGSDTESILGGLKEVVTQFGAISKELRTRIMDIRKVEALTLLQKTHRLVRDIATEECKQIKVINIGENIRIDKSYIDLLDAPLTHMVRNAADHGIESPAERTAAGKPETGTITTSLSETADTLQLSITDDGAGLNYEGLRNKAVELGFIAKEATLTNSTIVDLLFMSGVSTARKVTDISGRGVGMDVVKKAIVGAGGKIDVTTETGKGTTFSITVPRNASTQIFDGYVVSSFSNANYVLPLSYVIEAFAIHPTELSSVSGQGKIVVRRDIIYPVQTLDVLVGECGNVDTAGIINHGAMGILVELKNRRTVILVKNIVGIQKVVCKPVEGTLLGNDFFEGAAISGTGTVSMIVNMEKLLQSR